VNQKAMKPPNLDELFKNEALEMKQENNKTINHTI
jgi:hypothetical protein